MIDRSFRTALLLAAILAPSGIAPAAAQGAAPPSEAAPPEAGSAAAPKTALPPHDAPRAQQPGQRAAEIDPDWPCQQRKVGSMSYGQMWSGPPLDDAQKSWRDDEAVANLASTLIARRVTMDEAKRLVAEFANAAGDRKPERLVVLFAAVFDELNEQRSRIVDGIERYARKQRALSDRIKEESLKISATQQDMASQMSPDGQKDQEALNWDTRIYEERSQSLTYVCETPVILEQRAFDLGREIQGQLN